MNFGEEYNIIQPVTCIFNEKLSTILPLMMVTYIMCLPLFTFTMGAIVIVMTIENPEDTNQFEKHWHLLQK